jgi:hypothetical protein
MANLSKTRFLSGLQCEKRLYYDVYQPELGAPPDADLQGIFDRGHAVGKLAHALFPGGLDASADIGQNRALGIQRTLEWLEQGVNTIYEAAFAFPGGYAAVDILHYQDGERHMVEVKSSTEVKPYVVKDAAYLYFVLQQAGFPPDKVFILHINKAYEKRGKIQPAEFFTHVEITQEVLALQAMVQEKHTYFLNMLENMQEPIQDIGKHCRDPFLCPYYGHCGRHLPEQDVFQLTRAMGKDWALYAEGIYGLEDIPEDYKLTTRQALQVRGIKYGEKVVEAEKIRGFLNTIKAPIYFFDFETVSPVFPILDGTHPFDQIPFQYSCHETNLAGDIRTHGEYLNSPEEFREFKTDPRRNLIQSLKSHLGSTGSIVVYYASFERSRLQELARAFPEESEFLNGLIERLVDLIIPFQQGWYYDPAMQGSASLKYVLPAMAPEFSYSDLEIRNGGVASDTFLRMVGNTFEGDRVQTMEHLLQYCGRDTQGMVEVYKALLRVVVRQGNE